MRLLVTRPQPQADEWVLRLGALGVDAVALPLLRIAGPSNADAVAQAWSCLGAQRLVVFVSPNVVLQFFARRGTSMAWPNATLAAGTGPGTAAALHKAGVPDACVVCPASDSASFDSQSLWPLLRDRIDWRAARVLIVRGEGGRDQLARALAGQGAQVSFVAAYRRLAPALDGAAAQRLAQAQAWPAQHVWLFSSSEAARQLPTLAPGAQWRASTAVATHARIAETVHALGFGRVIPVRPMYEAVVAAVAAVG